MVGDRPLSLSLSPPPQTVCGSPVPALPAEPGGFLLRAGHKHRAGLFQTLPTTVTAPRDYRQSPARLLGDPAQSLESTGHQALGAPLAPALQSHTWLFNTSKIHPEILFPEDSLCHSRPSQKEMRFQPCSTSTRCPLLAPSQEEADVPLGFSPPLLGKIPAQASLL